jgi:hypothetical protein
MKTILLIISLTFSLNLFSQVHQIGHKTITFVDPARSNRNIETEVYYPAPTGGEDVAFANGQFPLIVFGHGFVMGYADLYQYLWDSLVPQGYICAFPLTESSSLFPPPNHLTFGLDLAFLNSFIKSENTVNSSFFYNHVGSTSAIGGHSMGGKASAIACKSNTNVTAMFNMGAALSNPPLSTPIDVLGEYAIYITVPSLILSGEKDNVAPAAENQIPLYDTITSTCKTFISITGGWHCYFASKAGTALLTNCESGESPNNSMTRSHQNDIVMSYLRPFLASVLKGDAAQGASFVSKLTSDSEVTYKRDCSTAGINNNDLSSFIYIYPNPANEVLNIDLTAISNKIEVANILDITGRIIKSYSAKSASVNSINISQLPSGVYFVKIVTTDNEYVKRFVK